MPVVLAVAIAVTCAIRLLLALELPTLPTTIHWPSLNRGLSTTVPAGLLEAGVPVVKPKSMANAAVVATVVPTGMIGTPTARLQAEALAPDTPAVTSDMA